MKFITEKETEGPIIRLWLVDRPYGIVLKGHDGKGNTKTLMKFRDGKFRRFRRAELTGLETDEKGRIIESSG